MNSSYAESKNRKLLEGGIRLHLQANDTYHFRPIKIDGINVYMVLYGKYKILNVESIYIYCNTEISGKIEKQQYSLYHCQYKYLSSAINMVDKIKRTYRIYNGEMVSPNCYSLLKLEESILPFDADEKCTVCYENTSDITPCGHSICLSCRELCILKNKKNCPICRSANALEIYTNRSGLVNNEQFNVVKRAIHSEKYKFYDDDFIPFSRYGIFNEEEEAAAPAAVNNNNIETEQSESVLNETIEETSIQQLSSIQPDEETIDNDIPEVVFWIISRSPSIMEDDIINRINNN